MALADPFGTFGGARSSCPYDNLQDDMSDQTDVLQGTLDLLILRTLALEASTAEIGEALLSRHFDRKHGAGAYYGQD